MKLIPLTERGSFKTRDIIKQIAMTPVPGKPIDFVQMGKRCRIIEAVDAAQGGELLLEDADFEILRSAIHVFPFAVAHPDLLFILNIVVEAKAPAKIRDVDA